MKWARTVRALRLVLLAGVLGCSAQDRRTPTAPAPTNQQIVLANVEWVRAAADSFAAANGTAYPADLATDTTPDGDTLMDLLPNGERLLNPYTGEYTEPRDGAAVDAGQVGYQQVLIGGAPSSFLLTAQGEAGEIARVDNLASIR